jgi:hypothetical protein
VRGSFKKRSGQAALALAVALAGAPAHADDPPAATGAEGDPSPPADESPAPPEPAAPAAPEVRSAKTIVVWPTLTPAGDAASPAELHKPAPTEGALHARAQELEATLRDAVQDLGFAIDIGDPGPDMDHTRDLDMVERASHSTTHGGPSDPGTWLVSPRLEPLGGDTYLLRVVVVPPRSKQLRVQVERVSGADVTVRALVILRELLTSVPPPRNGGEARQEESARFGIMNPLRSQGRAVLAANAALFGAFAAYSIQRASGSTDPRLIYPLLTLGTGVGLGGALLVAEEWDVGTGDAWTLAGGAWWGAAAGVLIANGQRVQPVRDRYAWGVGGGLIGLSLATFSLTRAKADEGDAVLVHSGAAFGLSLGALGDLFYHANLERTPYTGAGVGTAAGLVSAGALAVFARVSPSRMLLIDLGAGLGAAAGAAVGSPLVFENVTEAKTRGFLAATAAGTLAGGGIAWWLTRDRRAAGSEAPSPDRASRLVPMGGVIGASATREGAVPAYGVGARGTW